MKMRYFEYHWLMENVAREMRRVALTGPTYDGLNTSLNRQTLWRCTGVHIITGSKMIFSRDAGHHSGGWWKNPDYERCWHLSLSFFDPVTELPRDKDVRLTEQWIEAFFHDDKRCLWSESPFSLKGKALTVWHYRVFCNPAWEPIIPKGEVYSKELTEAGWRSFSDLQTEHARELAKLEAQPGEQ